MSLCLPCDGASSSGREVTDLIEELSMVNPTASNQLAHVEVELFLFSLRPLGRNETCRCIAGAGGSEASLPLASDVLADSSQLALRG